MKMLSGYGNRSQLFCICLLSFCCLVSTACGIGGGVGKVNIIGRVTNDQVKSVGNQDVLAACVSGEQLVGGGYHIQNTDPSLQPIVAEASYPDTSTSTTRWHVTFFNPDDKHTGDLITAFAYCLTTPNFPVGVSVQQTASTSVASQTFGEIRTQCPNGNAVLGGGYKTNHLGDLSSRYNGGILASAPLLDNSVPAQARGWRVRAFGYGGDPLFVTAYVLCASMNLTPALPASSTPQSAPGAGIPSNVTSNVCGTNQLTMGGGFIINDDITVLGAVYDDEATADLTAWTVKGVLTFGRSLQAWAACVNVPTS